MAVIEEPPSVSKTVEAQMIWATPQELEMYRKTFPYLQVRWAERADLGKWRFSQELFSEKDLREEFLG